MRLTLPEPDIPEDEGFTEKNDIFKYREFGERLANLVSSINEPLVINLDAPWGSGKTVFIKQWAGLIRKRGGKAVYFDAFAHDFHENAFLSLASQIHSEAAKTLKKNKNDSLKKSLQGFLNATKKAGKVISPIMLSNGLRIATADLVNHYVVEDAFKAFINESEKVISEKVKNFNEECDSLQEFRTALEKVSEDITKKRKDNTGKNEDVNNEKKESDNQSFPLIFIVDELDRCRPSFALEIIERIKHLFSVKNVCFVLVTNLSYLETSLRGAYGEKFDAPTYLEKFYHLKIVLPKPDFDDPNQRNKYLTYLWEELQPKIGGGESDAIRNEIEHLAKAHELSLRQMEHVMRSIVLVAASSSKKSLLNSPVTAGFCIMRQTHPKLYDKARENKLTWDEIEKFLKIDRTNYRNEVVNSWRYLADMEAPEGITKNYPREWERYFEGISLPRDRYLLQRIFTNDIDSLFGSQSDE